SPATGSLSGTAIGSNTNLALGRPTSESSEMNAAQTSAFAVDGDAKTYWESANKAFPQWLQGDLGAQDSIRRVVLKLPPSTAWATRTQTLSVLTSTNNTTFTTAVTSASYTFNPTAATPNTVSITVPGTTAQYVRINFTANSGWPAGQASEFE